MKLLTLWTLNCFDCVPFFVMILPILSTIDPTNVKRNDSQVSRYSQVSHDDSSNDSCDDWCYSRYSQVSCNDSRVSHKWENMLKPPLIWLCIWLYGLNLH